MSSPDVTRLASVFIRDLYYNPKLRDQYFTAIDKPSFQVEAAVDKVLADNNYSPCKATDLGLGWRSVLLSATSEHQLTPA